MTDPAAIRDAVIHTTMISMSSGHAPVDHAACDGLPLGGNGVAWLPGGDPDRAPQRPTCPACLVLLDLYLESGPLTLQQLQEYQRRLKR